MTAPKPKRNALNYSEMTDNVYWYKGNGQRIKVNENFMTVLFLMAKKWAGKTGKGFRSLFKATDDEHEDLYLDVRLLTREEVEEEKKKNEINED